MQQQPRSLTRVIELKDQSTSLPLLELQRQASKDEVLGNSGNPPSRSIAENSQSTAKRRLKFTAASLDYSKQADMWQQEQPTLDAQCRAAFQLNEDSLVRARQFLVHMDKTGKEFPLTKQERRDEVRKTIMRAVKLICKLLSNGLTNEDVHVMSLL
jgi:hypothetical protein